MFSQDCRANVVRHSYDICMSVANFLHGKFAKISRRQDIDTCMTVAGQLFDIFW